MYAPAKTHCRYGSKKYGLGNLHSAGAMVRNRFGKAHNHTSPRRVRQCLYNSGCPSASKHLTSIIRTRSASESCTISQYPLDDCESRAMMSAVTCICFARTCAEKNLLARDLSYRKNASSRCSPYTRTLDSTLRVQECPMDKVRLVSSSCCAW